ncbi:MAG: hypothetical protein JSU69_05890, partial [Candidatus Zixiibacteriota bacterium]
VDNPVMALNEAVSACLAAENEAGISRAGDQFIRLAGYMESAGQTDTLEYIYHLALYGGGWCKFWLGELRNDVGPLLEAVSYFEAVSSRGDSLGSFSAYMVGESLIKAAVLWKYEYLHAGEISSTQLEELKELLSQAAYKFTRAKDDATLPVRMQVCAEIRLADTYYETGKIYQSILDGQDISAAFDMSDYSGIADRARESAPGLRGALEYSEAMRCLRLQFSRIYDQDCDAAPDFSAVGGAEQSFRLANRDHIDENWADAERYYKQAANSHLGEAYYWLGYLQLIQGKDDEAMAGFDAFNRYKRPLNTRLKTLSEDAERKLGLEKAAGITAESAREYLTAITEPEKKQQALRIALYLLRRAASRGDCSGRNPFLKKAYVFLDLADSPETKNEVRFFRAVAKSMEAICYPGDAAAEHYVREVADYAADVKGKYQYEAKYLEALCLFRAWETIQSRTEWAVRSESLFRGLINNQQSVRSLYYYGQILRLREDNHIAAAKCYETVLLKTKDCAGYDVCYRSAEAALNFCEDRGDISALDAIKHSSVTCPDNLVEGEDIHYEGIATWEGAARGLGQESIEMLKKFGLPKKSIYPGPRRFEGSDFARNAFSGIDAGVPVPFGPEAIWKLKLLVLRAENDKAVVCRDCILTDLDNEEVLRSCDSEGYYVYPKINVNNAKRILISKDGYYRVYYQHVCSNIVTFTDTVVLSQEQTYQVCDEKSKDLAKQLVRDDLDLNFFIGPRAEIIQSQDSQPARDFETDIGLRDFAWIPGTDIILVVSDKLSDALLRYNYDSKSRLEPIALGFGGGPPLNSPEGIVVDRDHNVYIADWGNDSVSVFKQEEDKLVLWKRFSALSKRREGAVEQLIHPTRIAVEEDKEGLLVADQAVGNQVRVYRDRHILVADRYGIHKFDSQGYYLDSPLKISPGELIETNDNKKITVKHGSIYAIDASGYGKGCKIYFVDRLTGDVTVICAR